MNLKSKSALLAPLAASFLLSFDEDGNRDTKYFSVVTFSPGGLDIKLFVSAFSGKAEVLDNPFRVCIWEKLRENPNPNRYKVTEYRLLNINSTKFAKVQEETKTSE